MTDYTPTTGEVMTAVVTYRAIWGPGVQPPATRAIATAEETAQYVAEFERWHAQVKAEAQVEALREAATSLNDDFQGIPAWREAYLRGERTDDWMKGSVRTVRSILSVLNDRADRIAREAGIETGGNDGLPDYFEEGK